MFNLLLHKKALKAYEKLNNKTAARVNKALDNIAENPLNHSNIKKLKGEFEGSYRYRLGGIRIIYSVDEKKKTVFIEALGARGDIYKK